MTPHPADAPTPPATPASLLAAAKEYHRRGDLPKALSLYDRLLVANPRHIDLLYFSGMAQVSLGAYADAVRRLSLALTHLPDNPALLHNLAMAHLGLRALDVALDHFKASVRLHPDNPEAYYRMGQILFLQKQDLDTALGYLDESLRQKPNQPDAYSHKGYILLEQGKLFASIQESKRALALNPEQVLAHKLLALALYPLGITPLADYHQKMTFYYAKLPPTLDTPTQHTFFLDRDKALRTALQGHRITELVPDSGLQLCYHLGKPFPEAPPNLVALPSLDPQTFVSFFLASRFSPPDLIDFKPEREAERTLAQRIATYLYQWWMAREHQAQQLERISLNTRPKVVPGTPWRVCLHSSRWTIVNQYSCRDLAQGFRDQGCEVLFSIEADDRECLQIHQYLQERIAFDPHIVVNVNKVDGSLNPDVFGVTWWQDPTGALLNKTQLPWKERSLIYSIGQEIDPYLEACGAPKVRRQGFCYRDDIFKDYGNERQRKVALVATSNTFKFANGIPPNSEKMIATLEEMLAAGEPLTNAELTRLASNAPFTETDIFWHMWHYVVRDQSARWLCELAAEEDIEVEVYGHFWEQDPIVSPFAKGVMPHGTPIADLYNEARYTLVAHPFDLHSQRLMETAACGSIPIVYDCRYRADPPHWDDHCLWYRTKEEMRACLTQTPPKPPQQLSLGSTFSDFAGRILAEVEAHRARPSTSAEKGRS